MSNQKKQIILNEITFWKKNKLLPDHYCDFLLTLYTEGNNENEELKGNASQAIKVKEKRKNISLYLIVPVVAIFLVVLLFTLNSVWLIAAIAGAVAIACLVGAFYFAKKNQLLTPILHVSAALLFLAVSVQICLTYYPENNAVLYGALAANCVMWLVSGLKLKISYFTVSGGLGIVAIVVFGFVKM
ncbi:hypothetical protein [Solibacillus sp. CAU 1738]|uniref:hypothetical protein n=1 Tax=Solibacillus sp. CAU 1738 TaxID=3140363 RepID=UPI00325FE575